MTRRDGAIPQDEFFYAEQNGRLVKNAEQYYRSMFRGRISSWNLRDRHMAETLEALLTHFDRGGQPSKIVVWEHNSHIGDARATAMGDSGEWNLGQLTREQFGEEAALLHQLGRAGFLLPLRSLDPMPTAVYDSRLERAIGVIYRPQSERISHYFEARLFPQFDALIHFDETRAVEPLDPTAGWDSGESPETFPSGF